MTNSATAVIEIRHLPAQSVAAVEIAGQLRERGWTTVFVAARLPKWFVELYPDIAGTTHVISDKKINVRYLLPSLLNVMKAAARVAILRLSEPTSLHNLRLRDVQVGDLILDSAIRGGGARVNLVKRWAWIIRAAVLADQTLRNIADLFRKCSPELIVVSSRSYASLYGLMCRYGEERGLRVLSNSPAYISFTRRDPDQFRMRMTPRSDVRDFIARARSDSVIQGLIEEFIMERFTESSVNKDFRRVTISSDANRTHLAINRLGALVAEGNGRPLVYLAPHAFADAVHVEGPQLFRDYKHWFVRTIQSVQSLPGATWVTKSHPAAADYGELSLVGDILRKHDKAGRVIQLDDATPPAEIMAAASAVVTVRGTVGMEFGAHKKRVLLAGSSKYAHLGFSISPETTEDYFKALAGLTRPDLTPVDAFAARAALYFFESQLIVSRMPGSAFSADAHDLMTEDWATIARRLEEVRTNGTDPFLRRVSDTLDARPPKVVYE